MSEDKLDAGVEVEAEAEAEADESENLGKLVSWLESLEVGAVEPPTGIEPNLEEGTHSPKGGSSKSRRRRKKTEFQKEYNRISQRERRQEKRRTKRAEKGDSRDIVPSDFANLLMIYLAYNRDGSLRKASPKSVDIAGTEAERVLRDYMRRHEEGDGIEFSTLGKLGDYVAIKRNEVICLRRSLNVLKKREKYYEENAQTLNTKVVDMDLADRSGIIYKESFSAIDGLAVVRHAAVVLPILLMQAEGRLEELTVKLEQRREAGKALIFCRLAQLTSTS